jgi:hypothetical protein
MKKSRIVNLSLDVVITTLVYALLATTFFEMDNVLGGINVVIDNDKNNDNNNNITNNDINNKTG